jgi:VWFA-related protein
MAMALRIWRSAIVAGISMATVVAVSAQAPRMRKVAVTVVDKSGAALADLTDTDFSVKEGGTARDIVSLRTLPTKFRLAIIDSDGGMGTYQGAIGKFVQTLLKEADQEAELSFVSVVEQPEVVMDYAVEPQQIVAGINRLGQRAGGRPRPGQLMDAITGVLKNIARPGYRPVIVVFRIGKEAPSADRAQNVRDAMEKSGVSLFVVSPPGAGAVGSGGGGGGGGGNMAEASGQFGDATMADASMQLQLVLEDGSKESGGRSITANGNSAVKAMDLLAGELLNTYEITYVLPDGASPSDSVSVAVGRKDAKIATQSRVR